MSFTALLPAFARAWTIKLLVASTMSFFAWRAASAYLATGDINVLLLLVSESITVALILIAKTPKEVS